MAKMKSLDQNHEFNLVEDPVPECQHLNAYFDNLFAMQQQTVAVDDAAEIFSVGVAAHAMQALRTLLQQQVGNVDVAATLTVRLSRITGC